MPTPQRNGDMDIHIRRVVIVLDSYATATLRVGNNGYKGTERSMVYMIEELCRRKIFVILVAPGGSDKPEYGILLKTREKALWKDGHSPSPDDVRETRKRTMELVAQAVDKHKPDLIDCQIAHDLDVDRALAKLPVPVVVTFHGPLTKPSVREAIRQTPNLPIITVSNIQRQPLKDLEEEGIFPNFIAAVPNGIPDLQEKPIPLKIQDRERRLLMLGRFSPKKAFPDGIKVAAKANIPITVAGTVIPDQKDPEYYDTVLLPWIHLEYRASVLREIENSAGTGLLTEASQTDQSSVTETTQSQMTETGRSQMKSESEDPKLFITERKDVNETNKAAFFKDGYALLALTKQTEDEWGPPYIEADGMHITEALRSDVAVIGTLGGIDEGKLPANAQFLYEEIDEMVECAVQKIPSVPEGTWRRHFLENFEISVTAEKKIVAWKEVIRQYHKGGRAAHLQDRAIPPRS